jgi:SAM-dependent methyltransferase
MNARLVNGRPRFSGVAEIAMFNWHWYVAGAAVIVVAGLTLVLLPGMAAFRVAGLVACGTALAWAVVSLAVSHWVYDLSALRRWRWIPEALPTAPLSWCNIHCGFDESSETLRELFPGAAATVLDIFDGGEMKEMSIARARKRRPARGQSANFRCLPVPPGSQDAVFLLFAAHELRSGGSRDALLGEVHRILRDNGCAIVAEHLRAAPNVCAFGPGAWHFFSRREWLRVFADAALPVANEFSITAFVRVFVLRRGQ